MFKNYLDQFQEVLASTIASTKDQIIDLDLAFDAVVQTLKQIRENGQYVYLVGNGGSSGIVSHGAIDFVNACGFKAQALTDNSLLTCMANDYGYENVFAQPLKTILDEKDLLIAISSSGTSANIVNACKLAKEKGSTIVTLSGFEENNPLRKSGDLNFWLSSNHYGRVEIGHSLLLHYITDRLANK